MTPVDSRTVGPPWRAFVGSYRPPHEQGIHVMTVDRSGAPRIEGGIGGIHNPSYLCVHPDGRHLYAVSETGLASDGVEGGVVALRIEDAGGVDGDLRILNRRSTLGDHPCHVSIDRTGRWLVAVNYGSGEVVVFPIDEDGYLHDPATRIRHTGRGPNPERQLGPHPHASAFSPDGRYLFVADLGIDRVIVHAFDDRSGDLQEVTRHRAAAGAGPRHLAFHPDGEFVFVVNELHNTLSVLAWNARTANLHETDRVSTLPADWGGSNLAAGVQVSHAGHKVHVSNRGHDSVVTHAFDPGRGLDALAVRSTGGRWPRAIAVAPTSEHLLVANEHSDRIVSMSLAAAGADAVRPGASIDVVSPSAIVFG